MYHPIEVRVAQDHGHGEFRSFPLEMPFAPGTTLFSVSPPEKAKVWEIYVVTYGEITPSPPTSDFWFEHWQVGVKRHTTPFVHSLMDFPNPMWAPCTQASPHRIEAHNETGAVQTVDVQFYLITFDRDEDWGKWMADLILLGHRLGVGTDILKAVGLSPLEFEGILSDRRDVLIEEYPFAVNVQLKVLVEGVHRLIALIERLPEVRVPEVPEAIPEAEVEEALQRRPDPKW